MGCEPSSQKVKSFISTNGEKQTDDAPHLQKKSLSVYFTPQSNILHIPSIVILFSFKG